MSDLHWVKSSYSDAGGNNCVEVATLADGSGVALRESESPGTTLVARHGALKALLTTIKAGGVSPNTP
ncbi:DUF397 domain-containing protein [Streptomyces sp. NPDC005794]|uniref:DUF397 domain-containing protein n=1 Tax=Streptomyces sp. NPDC005794 TaxID=3364733 RepID=UPI0036ACF1E8